MELESARRLIWPWASAPALRTRGCRLGWEGDNLKGEEKSWQNLKDTRATRVLWRIKCITTFNVMPNADGPGWKKACQ